MIRVAGFLGANLALQPMLLPETVGTVSNNLKPGRGDMRPWKVPLAAQTIPGGRQTIYRMGRDVVSDTNYWLSWTTDVHVVVGGNADDTAERTYYTGSGTPKWTNTTLALASPPYPTSARELGIPAPASACTLVASGGVSTLTEERSYTYTYVSDIGEESAPAAPSALLTCKSDDTVTINSLAAAPGGNYGITLIRVYRTQTGTSGATDFFFLREIASTLVTTTDDNRDLGETLATTTWLVPDPAMKFLTGLWNGMMAGIVGRSVRFCEAYVYYAWPIAYEILPTNAQPVALVTYGQNLVMLTNGNPSVIVGGSPESMDEQPIEFNQACIAPKSAVSMGHGVAWASPDGLAYVGQGGARLLTQDIMTRDDWQALTPSGIIGAMYEGSYFGFYAGGTKCFILNPANPQGMYFLDFGCTAVYLDPLQDALYILNGTSVQKFDAGATFKTATFKSKIFHQAHEVPMFSCAKIVGDQTQASQVSFSVHIVNLTTDQATRLLAANTQLVSASSTSVKYSVAVTNRLPFRLPSGFRVQDIQIEVEAAFPIQLVAMAHSMEDLGKT